MPKKKPSKVIKNVVSMGKFEVSYVREIRHHAVVEVYATSEDEAKVKADREVDNSNPYKNYWQEGDVVDQTVTVKEVK